MAGKRGISVAEETKGSPARPTKATTRTGESPLKRLRASMQQRAAALVAREEIILSTVEEFRSHVESRETGQAINPDLVVVVRGTLLWKTEHAFGERSLVRLHITDAAPEETLEELAAFEEFHGTNEEGRVAVDSLLLTATVFGETLGSQALPANGQVVRIVNSRRRSVYDGRFCQLVARLADITVEQA